MEDQNQVQPEIQQPSFPETGRVKKNLKIIGLFFAGLFVLFALFASYGFYLEKQDGDLTTNFENNMDTLKAEKMSGLKVATNVGNDHFVGTPEEQNETVDMFVEDNSLSELSDLMYLYLAANTAHLLNRPKEAMFLFYAAQLRKSFEYEIFAFGAGNGSDIQTYLAYLNQGAGQDINPLAVQNPEIFSEAIRMIEKWSVAPAEGAYAEYGKPQIAKSEWQTIGDKKKNSFLNEFAYKQEKILGNPETLAASRFMLDYNFGKIPRNPENEQKYEEYSKMVNSIIRDSQ